MNLHCSVQLQRIQMMPSKKIRKPPKRRSSITLHNKDCPEEVPKVIFRINPDFYPKPFTRSVKRMLDERKDFIIVEIYRCMPLLGNETEQAPDWTVHIVHYEIVFTDKH